MLRKNTIAIQTPFRFFNELEGYYPIPEMKDALKVLIRCVKRQEGFSIILGSTGTGKTLLCSLLEEKLRDDMGVVFLHNTNEFSPKSLYQSILFELGRPYRRMDENEMRLSLLQTMGDSGQYSGGLLLIVDEAHNLPIETLNELRLLSAGRTPWRNEISLVLSGNLQLEETLTHPKLEPLQQRTAVRICLEPWTKKETSAYIAARLKSFNDKLAVNSPVKAFPFSVESIGLIHSATAGIPRLVIQLCDLVYIQAVEQKLDRISADLVQAAWAQLQQLPTPIDLTSDKFGCNSDGSRDIENSGGLGGSDGSGSRVNQGKSDSRQENCIEFGSLDDDLQVNPFDKPGKSEKQGGTASGAEPEATSGFTDDLTSDLTDSAVLEVGGEPEVSQSESLVDVEPELSDDLIDLAQTAGLASSVDLAPSSATESAEVASRASEPEKIGYNRGNCSTCSDRDGGESEPQANQPQPQPVPCSLTPEQLAGRVSPRSLVNRITERAAKPIEEIVERATDILRRLDKIEAYFTSYCTVDYVDSPLSPTDCLPDDLPTPDAAFASHSSDTGLHGRGNLGCGSDDEIEDADELGNVFGSDSGSDLCAFDADLDARLNRRLDAAEGKPRLSAYQDPFAEDFQDEEAVRVDEAHPIPKSPYAQHHSGVVRSVPEDQDSQNKRVY